jgi:hypothetical protein
MAESTPLLTQAQWIDRLSLWAVERWGPERAEAIRSEIEVTAQHLVLVSAYPFTMEQMPDFFIE